MITNFKDLDKVMQLCRKNGVESIKIGDIEFKIDLSAQAITKPTKTKLPSLAEMHNAINPFDPTAPISDDIRTPDQLTADQLLFYSSNGEAG